ncbi:MAG: App1 family protein, partial [Bacteroidetes bacterium]|nr:App1 family protein [Fibrella sp.]
TGEVHVPYPTQYGFISDIDDTFLISHSATKFKRLLVLLTENARCRMPLEGFVTHYQALSRAGTDADAPTPFFYVSSSEWNLYEYILEFSRQHQLPTGVLMLSQLKRFRQLWQTGQNKHLTKLDRIAWILAAFPTHKFILLGDDTQADPVIYATVVGHHPDQIRCVYLRQVGAAPKPDVQAIVATIEAAGLPCCYFDHSAVAMAHSRQLGLI